MWVNCGGDNRRPNSDLVEQFSLADVSTYRSKEKQQSIMKANEIYLETGKAIELADNVFTNYSEYPKRKIFGNQLLQLYWIIGSGHAWILESTGCGAISTDKS